MNKIKSGYEVNDLMNDYFGWGVVDGLTKIISKKNLVSLSFIEEIVINLK